MTKLPFEGKSIKKAKIEVFLIVLFFLTSSALGGYIYYLSTFQDLANVCLNEDCLQANLDITTSIDSSLDPCDNFYQYCCGLPTKSDCGKFTWNDLVFQNNQVNNQLNNIISGPVTGKEWEPLLPMRQFYQSCRDTKAIDDDNNNDILKSLMLKLNGWPVLHEEWREQNYDLLELLTTSHKLGLPFEQLFRISYNYDYNLIQVTPAAVEDHFSNIFHQSAYFNLMMDVAIQLGSSQASAEPRVTNYFEFEYEMYKIWSNYNSSENKPITVQTLKQIFPNLDISALIQNISEEYLEYDNTTNIVSNENFLNRLNLLLAGTSKRTHVNYIIWRLVKYFGPYLAHPIRNNFEFFFKYIKDRRAISTRRERCLDEAKIRFPRVAESAYIKTYLNEDIMEEINLMVSSIIDSLINLIQNSKFIDGNTKKHAITKLKNAVLFDFGKVILSNVFNIDRFNLTSNNTIDSIREINRKHFQRRFLFTYTSPVDDLTEHIFDGALRTDIKYLDQDNIIVIPVSLLQEPFFSVQRPDALNYAILGTMIAKQLANAIDINESRDIDKNTWIIENVNVTMAENETMQEFLYRTINATESSESGNEAGKPASSIYFADLLPMDAAYDAWISATYNKPNIPGLSYTPEQLFWIYFGVHHCYQDIEENESLLSDIYTKFNNAVGNSTYFTRDFQCRSESNVGPLR